MYINIGYIDFLVFHNEIKQVWYLYNNNFFFIFMYIEIQDLVRNNIHTVRTTRTLEILLGLVVIGTFFSS